MISVKRQDDIRTRTAAQAGIQESVHGFRNSEPVRMRVLVADDEPAMLDAISLFFQDDHEIITCETSDHARKLFASYSFDLVICDLRLGKDNGAELLTEFRAVRPECERILMTGYMDTTSLIQSINEAGIAYYLTKPIDLFQLRIMIERVSETIALRNENISLMNKVQEHNLHLEKLVALRSSELQRANDTLRSLQHSREQVVRMAVHDLQNPLNNLDAILGELLKMSNEQPDITELLDIARQSSQMMRSLVEDMLSIAVLSKPDMNVRRDSIEIATLLRSSARAFASSAEQKNIWLNVEVEDNIPMMEADAIHLRKALDNLVSNAVKYTQPGGAVTLRAHLVPGYVIMEVKDSGLGMSEDDIRNAFQEFTRLSAQPTGNETSTGLGLYIVKKIIELHHGDVSIHSPGHGKGTTFTITLPLHRQH
ncbi:MAG: hybrid sensor histidine kinase/response regulator [Candidatus Kapabacteria bacterium]|nr:hybrid sensor histidine kinase/response regulator [Candidatus Kapabacteria bacterium]